MKSKRALKVGRMSARCTRTVMEALTRCVPVPSFAVARSVCSTRGRADH